MKPEFDIDINPPEFKVSFPDTELMVLPLLCVPAMNKARSRLHLTHTRNSTTIVFDWGDDSGVTVFDGYGTKLFTAQNAEAVRLVAVRLIGFYETLNVEFGTV